MHIETLDNPGWAVRIDLFGTDREDAKFEPVVIQRSDEDDWIHGRVVDNVFEVFGGSTNLDEMLAIFLNWYASEDRN